MPFRKKGSDYMIDLTVNGRSLSVAFDPASSDFVVPRKNAKQLGIEGSEESVLNAYNPATNPNGPVRGEAGYGEVKKEASAEVNLKLGQIVKSGVKVKLDDDAAATAKIGAGVFSDYQCTIDNQGNVIHFKR